MAEGVEPVATARAGGGAAGWPLLGLAGSVLLALAAPAAVDHGVVRWWYSFHILPGRLGEKLACYVGIAALCAGWVGIGLRLRRGQVRQRDLLVVGALWTIPLLLGPAIFSGDAYSYIAQGMTLHLGINPYHADVFALRRLGYLRAFKAVSPFWRRTPAPYGPFYLWGAGLVVGALNASLIPSIIVLRLFELAGVGLLAVFVPRLARLHGADPVLAIWLGVANPLVLFELLAAGHNDALMAGLMVAGVTLALERRPLIGIVLCSLAGAIKLPGLVAVVFIGVTWARSQEGSRAKSAALLGSAALSVAVLAALSALSGTGDSWISPSVFSTPGKSHLAVTPATAISWTVGKLLHGVGLPVNWLSVSTVFGHLFFFTSVVVGLVLLWRASQATLVACLGATLLLAAAGGPAAWPWYFTWGLVLVVALRFTQRWFVPVAAAVLVLALEVSPTGVLVLPRATAPAVLAIYLALAYFAWRHTRGPGVRRAALEELALPGAVASVASGELFAAAAASQPALPEQHTVL